MADGESIEVTDRGRPVAFLVPTKADPWEELLAGGQVIEAVGLGSVPDERPGNFGTAAS